MTDTEKINDLKRVIAHGNAVVALLEAPDVQARIEISDVYGVSYQIQNLVDIKYFIQNEIWKMGQDVKKLEDDNKEYVIAPPQQDVPDVGF